MSSNGLVKHSMQNSMNAIATAIISPKTIYGCFFGRSLRHVSASKIIKWRLKIFGLCTFSSRKITTTVQNWLIGQHFSDTRAATCVQCRLTERFYCLQSRRKHWRRRKPSPGSPIIIIFLAIISESPMFISWEWPSYWRPLSTSPILSTTTLATR